MQSENENKNGKSVTSFQKGQLIKAQNLNEQIQNNTERQSGSGCVSSLR